MSVGQQEIIVTRILVDHLRSAVRQGLEKHLRLCSVPVMVFNMVPEIFKSPGGIAYGIFNGNAAACVRFNGRCFAVVGKNPVMAAEF